MPAPSWPPIIGNIESTPNTWQDLGRGADVAGAQVLVGVAHPGVGHLDLHLVGPGASMSISSIFQGSSSPEQTAARVFMEVLPCGRRPRRRALAASIAPWHGPVEPAGPNAARQVPRRSLVESGGQQPEGPVHLAGQIVGRRHGPSR